MLDSYVASQPFDSRGNALQCKDILNDSIFQFCSKKKILKPYQVNKKLMKIAKSDAIFMHCLPVGRGEEVTDEVIDGKQSVVWRQALNRVHAQKSIIKWCLD